MVWHLSFLTVGVVSVEPLSQHPVASRVDNARSRGSVNSRNEDDEERNVERKGKDFIQGG